MADMDLQIKITAATQQAQQAITSLGTALKGINFAAIGTAVTRFGKSISDAGQAIDRFEKSAKKFGRDFTTNITLPIAALAGMSLKRIFDEAYKGLGTGEVNTFAAEVQNLKRSFDQLLITIGTQLAPMATKVVSFFNNLIVAYQKLNPETKELITNFGLVAAAIGPVALAISSVAGIVSKLMIVIGPLVSALPAIMSFFISPAGAIVALGISLIGLTNVFIDLKEAGLDTSSALSASWQLFSVGFNKYVIGSIISGLTMLFNFLSKFSGHVFGPILREMAKVGDEINKVFDNSFDSVVGDLNNTLAKTGKTVASSFLLGFDEEFSKFKDIFGKMTQTSGESLRVLEDQVKSSAQQIKMQISGDLSSGFLDIAEGSKTAEQAFNDFARSTIRNLSNMILQAMIFRTLFPQGGIFSSGASAIAQAGAIPGLATGGFVSGPGTGTSDSILARLSNGEFVSDAKTVSTFGSDFFHGLKKIARGGAPTKSRGVIPGFADGGLVGSSASAPQIVIQNTGSPKDVQETSFDPETAVTTVILQDLQKNGSLSKAMQSTFGVRRRGFT